MPNIDHMRYKAVQELEKMGWKFIDNRWEAPNTITLPSDPSNNPWKAAYKDTYIWHKRCWEIDKLGTISTNTVMGNLQHAARKQNIDIEKECGFCP